VAIPALFYSPVNSTGAPDHGYKIGFGAPVEFAGNSNGKLCIEFRTSFTKLFHRPDYDYYLQTQTVTDARKRHCVSK